MSGIYTDFWRIVKPAPAKTQYVQSNTEAAKLYSNFSWYTKVMKGASSRFSKYNQYKNMDSDVFVARALDTIAEEMTQINVKTNMPFEIEYQNESNKEVPETITMTVRAALRHWIEIQDLNTIIFDVARTVIKFGDCFFRKNSDFKKWQYLDPSDIIGISISEDGKPEHYHLRTGEKNKQGAFGDVIMVPAAGIVHFTLSSSMGDNGPFGESVLFPAIKAFRHLSLLEDSVIIYRIVRAPERRVFFVDVGNMPPQRVKAYLEAIKNELKQKRIPNESGGTDKIDSVYNPMCLTLDTRIPLLDGRTLTLQEMINEHAAGKQNWVYSCDPATGAVVPGVVSWAGVTRRDAEIVRVTLDNGKTITCTPDHKFPVLGRGMVEAQHLVPTDSLISYVTDQKSLSHDPERSYTRVFDHELNEFVMVHRLVAEYFRDLNKHQEFTFSPEYEGAPKAMVHHKNYDRYDNSPGNLTWMNHRDHALYHTQVKKEYWAGLKTDERARITDKISRSLKQYYEDLSEDDREQLTQTSSLKFKKMIEKMKLEQPEKYARWREVLGEVRKARLAEKEFFKEQLQRNLTCKFGGTKAVRVSRDTLGSLIEIIKQADGNREKTLKLANQDPKFLEMLQKDNLQQVELDPTVCFADKFSGKLTEKVLRSIYRDYGYRGWKHLADTSQSYNHKIVSVELLSERVDTGCITVDGDHKYHSHHTFALDAGVFTKNSMVEDYFFAQTADGRGSRVETLSGGENLGEIADLTYFQNKFLQGLRIPSSYMRGAQDGGAQINEGKVGIAYIEELRFANYVARLQAKINDTFDFHFNAYLKSAGINIDKYLFKLKLVDPQNFMDYKQAEVDEKMISNYSNVKDNLYLSERYKQKHYLGLSEDDIQENEAMLKQERGIPDGGLGEGFTELRMMYDPAWVEKRPEIKVSDDYDNFEDITTKAKPEAEAPPEEESGDEASADEKKGGEEKPAKDSADASGGDDTAAEEPKSTDDLSKEIDSIGKEAGA